jgi:hypothetical protein
MSSSPGSRPTLQTLSDDSAQSGAFMCLSSDSHSMPILRRACHSSGSHLTQRLVRRRRYWCEMSPGCEWRPAGAAAAAPVVGSDSESAAHALIPLDDGARVYCVAGDSDSEGTVPCAWERGRPLANACLLWRMRPFAIPPLILPPYDTEVCNVRGQVLLQRPVHGLRLDCGGVWRNAL